MAETPNQNKKISVYSLWKSGSLELHIGMGIIRSGVIEYCKIYEAYLHYRSRGFNYTRSVEFTAEKLSVTDITVKRAIAEVQ